MGYSLSYFDNSVFVSKDNNQEQEYISRKLTGSNYKLLDSEKKCVVDMYNSIPASEKCVLSTGKVVDDIMKSW